MALSSTKDFWIHQSALTFTLNYFGNPQLIQTSMLAGAVIMAYHKDYIPYDAAHNFRQWKLTAYPTQLNDTVEYYVHAELSRSGNTAMIIYSPVKRDLEGRSLIDGTWDNVTSEESYFIYLGTISASVDANGSSVDRVWTDGFYTGTLATDQYRMEEATGDWAKMFRWNSANDTIEVLKTIVSATINKLSVATQFIFGGKTFTGTAGSADSGNASKRNDATLPTSGYVAKEIEALDDHFLVKDETKAQTVGGDVTFTDDVVIEGDHTVGGSQAISGNQSIKGTQEVKGRTQFRDKVEFGKNGFAEGLTGYGGQVDEHGRAKFRSLELYESLTVPEINYNRITVLAGTQWRSAGGGIIESVVVDVDGNSNAIASGVVTLKLEEGEIGKVDVDDLCMGIFHNIADTSQNETEDVDDGRGNFRFSGFFTSYFRITEILESGNNSKFRYVLRESDGSWSKRIHPCAEMNFVGYGNLTKPERQNSRYSALTYERYLRGVNTWNFQADNIVAQFGDLSNLGVLGLVMDGYSAYLDNVYMRGTIQEVTALPLRMEIGIDGYQTMAFGETIHVECRVYRGWEDITDSVKKWSVVRGTADTSSDEAWLMKDKVRNFSGMIEIAWTESENDLGNMTTSGVSALFTFTASTIDDETIETSLEI